MLRSRFLAPSPKKIADKSCSPEETISLVEDRLRGFGAEVFNELKRVDKGRLGIPVYISIYGAEGLKVTGNVKQMGKGSTESLARASALMELIERFSLFWTVKNRKFPLRTLKETPNAISQELLLSSVIDPDEDKKACEVCEKILPEIPFHLAQAFDVYSEQEINLPFYWFWLLYEYNGSAAGNTYAEAAVQACCELIERHTSALASSAKEPFREIELDKVSDEAQRLLACFERLGVKLFLRDITYDMPAPTIAAMAYDPSTYPHRSELVYTAGTATSPDRALIRALTEVAQLAGDFDTEGKYLESGLPKYQTLEDAKIVLQANGKIRLTALPDISFDDHVLELKELAKRLVEKGFRLLLVDIACPGIDIPAVYAIIPGVYFRERIFLNPLYQLVRTISLYLEPKKALAIIKEISKELKRYYVEAYLGQVLSGLNRFSEAAEALEKALSLAPKFDDLPAIYCHLAHAYLQANEYKKAEEAAEKGLSYGVIPELLNIIGTARFKQGNPDRALEAYLQAVALNPQEPLEYANIGACLAALGLKDDAQEYFEKARSLDPTFDLAPYAAYLQGGTNV